MVDKNLYTNDLIHRYPSHTFTETTVNSETKVEFKNSSSVVIRKAQKQAVIDAYKTIRSDLLKNENLDFISTTTQRTALSLTVSDKGTRIFNDTTKKIEDWDGTAWKGAAGAGTMLPVAFGEMIEDNSSGSPINTTTKLWDTASVGELDPNTLITFVSGTNEDYLLVGTGGAGTYRLHYSITFTNAGGNITEAGIHKNGTEVEKLRDTHSGDSAEKRDLRGQGYLVLADGDKIKLHSVSSTPADVVTVYHGHVTMSRMT